MAEAISSSVLAARVCVSIFTERCLQVYQRGLPADMKSCSEFETSFGCVRGDERALFMVRGWVPGSCKRLNGFRG
jgi:hypothetical protein